MRTILFLLIAIISIAGCKPKDKDQNLPNLLGKDSANNEIKEEKNDLSVRKLIINKWRVTGTEPAIEKEEDLQEMLSTVIEFTSDGKVMVTNKEVTKEEATFTLTMDDKYMLSHENGKEVDSILIAEINPGKLVLIGEKDKRKIIMQPYK